MDKNTVLAVVLSAVLLIGGFLIIRIVYPPAPPVPQQTEQTEPGSDGEQQTTVLEEARSDAPVVSLDPTPVIEEEVTAVQETINAHTKVFDIRLTNKGAAVESIVLKNHADSKTGENLEMIITDETGGAFQMRFGDSESRIINDFFHVGEIQNDRNGNINSIEFYNTYRDQEGSLFKLTKTYVFSADEYLFEIIINIKKLENISTPIKFSSKTAYTLSYGQQIGPVDSVVTKSRYSDYRRFYTYSGKKRETVKFKKGEITSEIDKKIYWGAIVGKYFALIAVPGHKTGGSIKTIFTNSADSTVPETSTMSFERSEIATIEATDKYDFYFGPKLTGELKLYNNDEKNSFSLTEMGMEKIVDSGGIFALFEWLLRQGLFLIYKIIPNFGLAIIIITLLIKLILYPFTRKSLHSTSKMQALNPQIAEMRTKYKDNPQKLNMEMAALYKKEGVNPLGGCLPLLLQMPILIGFFQLLNKQFELRGAPFFGWITDLSQPESIIHFAAKLPLIGSDIRLLPILYVVTQLLSTKLTQVAAHSAAPTSKNMKFMQYGLPLIFFLLFYSAPSGLLLYWIVTNLATGIQQYVIQRRMRKKEEV